MFQNHTRIGVSKFSPHIIAQTGAGIFSDVASQLTGKPPGMGAIQELTKAHGSATMTQISVVRTPLSGALVKGANMLTGGTLNKAMADQNYDKFYHLCMIIVLSDGYRFKLEKNQSITISSNPTTSVNSDIMSVPNVASRQLRIDTAIDNCSTAMGGNFYTYSALSNNCQHFVAYFLKSNGFLTPELRDFIMQNVDQIKSKLPGFVSPTADTLTDFAGGLSGLFNNKVQSGGTYFDPFKRSLVARRKVQKGGQIILYGPKGDQIAFHTFANDMTPDQAISMVKQYISQGYQPYTLTDDVRKQLNAQGIYGDFDANFRH
jgi:hypothetical protein